MRTSNHTQVFQVYKSRHFANVKSVLKAPDVGMMLFKFHRIRLNATMLFVAFDGLK
jgi:hypothetical protein